MGADRRLNNAAMMRQVAARAVGEGVRVLAGIGFRVQGFRF